MATHTPTKFVTGEDIANLRQNRAAREQLGEAFKWTISEFAVAKGEVGHWGPQIFDDEATMTGRAKDAVQEYFLRHMAVGILERLENVVDRKSDKPIDKEAVGWAFQYTVAPQHRHRYADFMGVVGIDEKHEYRLTASLRDRLFEELTRDGALEKAKASGHFLG